MPEPAPTIYLPEIEEEGLVLLTTGTRALLRDLSAEDLARHEATWNDARQSTEGLLITRLGALPTNEDFAERLIVAGAIYMLSRKSENTVGKDQRDQREAHFKFLLEQAAKGRTPTAKENETANSTDRRSHTFPGRL